uniref:Neurotransmitter-gated ion-channel transmembrane domain-containing protein n=1 Tax=Hucho hucho TaxID=62062 RepID=A0A4W5KBK1_9TELE
MFLPSTFQCSISISLSLPSTFQCSIIYFSLFLPSTFQYSIIYISMCSSPLQSFPILISIMYISVVAGQYFSFAMMIVGLSLVVTVLVLQFHHHDPHGVKMPKWMRVILLNWCAWFLRMKKPGEERKTATRSTNTNTTPSSTTGGYKYSHPPPHHASTSSIQMGSIPGGQPSNTSTTNGNMNLYFGYHSMGMGGMGSLGGSHDNPCCPPSS